MKKPMRVLEGNAKPFEPFWRCVDAADSDSGEPEIDFYGYISEYSWFEDDITPARFRDDLMKLGQGGPVTIRIHSGGGDVFAASAIRAMIMDYPGRVTTRIDGLCASAATYVAMAGDRVVMQDTGYFMIHDPSAMAVGTVDDLKQVISLLKTIKEGIVDAYRSKTHLEAEQLSKMMSAETWMTAQEAKELGFVDDVISTRPAPMGAGMFRNVAVLNALDHFENVPEELMARVKEEEPTPLQGASQEGEGEVVVNITEPTLSVEDAQQAIRQVVEGIQSAVEEFVAETEKNVTAEEAPSEAAEAEAEKVEEELPEPSPLPSPAGEGEGQSIASPLQEAVDQLRKYLDVFGPRKE